jgi:Icc-related predicted phosphoesterase
MRLHILSDLHLEFGPVEVPVTDADVVVLAGDMHLGGEGLGWMRHCFAGRPVIYVLGNHEFYGHSIPELTESLRQETEESNLHLLENSVCELNGFVFLGCALWTDFRLTPNPEEAMRVAEQIMSDYFRIEVRSHNRLLRAADTVRLHAESLAWLKGALAKHSPERCIIVTHHAPSPLSIPPFHAGSPLNAAFASDLEELVENSQVPLWIHGHTHYNVDYKIGSTRVFTNQRGYPDEVAAGFDPGRVVEI